MLRKTFFCRSLLPSMTGLLVLTACPSADYTSDLAGAFKVVDTEIHDDECGLMDRFGEMSDVLYRFGPQATLPDSSGFFYNGYSYNESDKTEAEIQAAAADLWEVCRGFPGFRCRDTPVTQVHYPWWQDAAAAAVADLPVTDLPGSIEGSSSGLFVDERQIILDQSIRLEGNVSSSATGWVDPNCNTSFKMLLERVEPSGSAPSASAGEDQEVTLGDRAVLDGSESSDPDGDALLVAWEFAAAPNTSAITKASLSWVNGTETSFTPDEAGEYTLTLRVFDGNEEGTDTVTITVSAPAPTAPTADAGPDQTVTLPETVQLDGTGSSDPNGDTLTYAWSFDSVPTASTISDADLTDPNGESTDFEPDVAGEYIISLTVSDDSEVSTDTVTITVTQ